MLISFVLTALLGLGRSASPPAAPSVTILYDAFGGGPGLTRDWGFAALIEYQGKRILFDTGNNAALFERNVRRLNVDLSRLDFVIISHRHTDHTAGLSVVLRANPRVPIYVPRENFGMFGASVPRSFYRTLPTLPDSMRYFNGVVPEQIQAGTLWPEAHIELVDSSRTLAPGIRLVALVSDAPGTRELRELSLVLATPAGDILVVGCSHPGIERIIAARDAPATPVRMLVGGLHLIAAPDSALTTLADRLHHQWLVTRIAPGHCTGEPAFAALQREYGADYRYAGLGRRILVD